MPLYPLLLTPIYKEKVWGGRALAQLGRALPGGPETKIGESWEVADLSATSPSGGGGEAALSVVRNGPLMKRTLGAVIEDFGALVTGTLQLRADGSFPLLLKYLDARENLSVQVHPSESYAAEHPDAHLKSEAWYVVAAEPDAVIYRGVVDGTTPERFRAAIEDGSVPELLNAVPARAGDCHYLPSGTVHALGAGVLVAEVQTASDTTFRVFDWGRTDRDLHVEEAMACIDFDTARAPVTTEESRSADGDWVSRRLVSCEHFEIIEHVGLHASTRTFDSPELAILMVVRGRGTLTWGEAESRELALRPADTALLPAGLEAVEFRADDDVTVLEVTAGRKDT